MIIVATVSGDSPMPATAVHVQQKLGADLIPSSTWARASRGFLYAMTIADQFITAGTYKTILVVGADLMSRRVDPTDRVAAPLFGDGAGRWCSGRRTRTGAGSCRRSIHADGTLAHLLSMPGGGSAEPMTAERLAAKRQFDPHGGQRALSDHREAPVELLDAGAQGGGAHERRARLGGAAPGQQEHRRQDLAAARLLAGRSSSRTSPNTGTRRRGRRSPSRSTRRCATGASSRGRRCCSARSARASRGARRSSACEQQAHAQCTARGVRPWFVVDREGDARPLLLALSKLEGARFTVRSSWDRVVESTGKDRQYLRATLAKEEPLCVYSLEVPAGSNRQARTARMELRAQRVKVRLRDKWTKKIEWLEMSAVWAREVGTAPKGERALDWLLYTNTVVDGAESARSIVNGYATRWRIEEFHKTWKTGACNAERMQLRSSEAAMRWAIILAAVATRIERLKYKARTTPNAAATDELGRDEVKMLVALAPGMKKRAEKAPDESLTIGEAVHWIARIGGYTGTSSGGPPGSITIGRGLERLGYAVDGARAAGIFR
jgi:hypothetical protein